MKTIILVRGVSGSGKTTFAEMISGSSLIISTDDYWKDARGGYNFDASKLPEAHKWCQDFCRANMASGLDIIVHNTFTQEWEMEPYFVQAEEFGYKIFTIIVESRHGGKNIHDVPDTVLEKQKNRFSVKL